MESFAWSIACFRAAAFSSGEAKVLVATDVAARGVHVDNIELVIHVDPPAEHKAYLHRSGRTARAGSAGDVVTIMLPTQKKDTLSLLRKAAIEVTPQRVTPTTDAVLALVGEVADYVKPAPKVVQQRGGGQSQGANAQRKRAARGGGAGGQRRDRSGRPARSSSTDTARAGQAARSGRGAGSGSHAPASRGGAQSRTSYSTSSYSTSSPAPTGGQRRAGRRAQG